MITYYLRPDGTQVKIDSDNQTVSNIVNKNDQKIIGHFIGVDYYNRISTDAVNLNWPTSSVTDFDSAKIEVLNYLTGSI